MVHSSRVSNILIYYLGSLKLKNVDLDKFEEINYLEET